jgi:hypothetical protein
MNRAVRNLHRRRCALKNMSRGGGLDVNPGAAFATANGVPIPENQGYTDCYAPVRPGALVTAANPDLAQAAMAGGANEYVSPLALNGVPAARFPMEGGAAGEYMSGLFVNRMDAAAPSMATGTYAEGAMEVKPITVPNMMGGGCGCMMSGRRRGTRGGRRSSCGAMLRGGHRSGCAAMLRGGKRTRRQRGGNKGGFGIDPSMSVGGTGPIAEPARFAVPCDARAGMANPFTAPAIPQDPRAPAFIYSATPNTSFQTGGAYSSGNAYPDSCYKAPGSEMPVYPATTAGFEFRPSTGAGATLPDGVTAYNEVVPVAARQAGGKRRKSRKSRKASKKSRKGRKGRMGSRKH